jgi:hypothetical protein
MLCFVLKSSNYLYNLPREQRGGGKGGADRIRGERGEKRREGTREERGKEKREGRVKIGKIKIGRLAEGKRGGRGRDEGG